MSNRRVRVKAPPTYRGLATSELQLSIVATCSSVHMAFPVAHTAQQASWRR